MKILGGRLSALDSASRASLPGSFVRLTRGYVHYELSGPENGPAVVLVPGLSVPYATFDRTAPFLASRSFRVLRYDHFGRGYSDRPSAEYGLETFIEQLAELLAALGMQSPAILVGLSMGGPVAAAIATRLPGIARGLALIDPVFEWPEQGLGARLLLSPLVGEALMMLAGARLLALGQRRDFFDETAYNDFIQNYLPPLRFRGIKRAVLATMRGLEFWPFKEVYGELGRSGIPTLLVWGREDAVLPLEQSERLLCAVSRAEFHCIAGAGHVPHWEKAEEVNRILEDFFLRLLG